ncbi:MAG: hypothetical protein WC378_15145 [Opitutaceae bacterium]
MGLLKMFLPAILDRKPDTCEDAKRQPELKQRLRDRVKKAGWGAVIFLILALPAGCTRIRTVYIPAGEPVRLREPVKNVKIWTLDKDGTPVPGVVDVPEGWYVLPDPGKE